MVQLPEVEIARGMRVSDGEIFVLDFRFWFQFMMLTNLGNWVCRYEFQMQYGSIGWSVGATLGYAQAAKNKRVIACIGDGSFQVYSRIQMHSSVFL